jgi:Tfp pilus assembly protein PilN
MSAANINLLPDLRQAKIRDKQRRQLAITIAVGMVVGVAALLVLGFLIIQGQNLRINQLTNSITDKKAEIKKTSNVNEILSLQARAAALPGLFGKRLYITKLLSTLSTNQPADVAFSSFSLTQNSVSISATGKSYQAAARIALALQQAKTNGQLDFTNVVLSAVSVSGTTTSYSITATVNPQVTSGK